MTRRTEKVSALLQQELGSLMNKLELPFLTTISKMEVTPDLKWAKAWITIFTSNEEDENQVLGILKTELPDLQKQINQKLKMKNVPRISFVVDHGEQYASRIDELLRETKEE